MFKKCLGVTLAVVVVLAMSVTGFAADQIVLRLAEIHPKDYPTTQGDFEFARLVEEKTKGRIKVEVYFGAQLGDEKTVVEQVQFGAIDFARISVSPVSEFAKELNALQMPYLSEGG